MKATMNTEVAVKRVGIINTPNQPMYKRFSVEVIHEQKRPHTVAFSRRSNVRSKEILYSTQLEKKKHVFFILKKVLPFLSGDAAMKAEEALDLLKSFSSDFDTKM